MLRKLSSQIFYRHKKDRGNLSLDKSKEEHRLLLNEFVSESTRIYNAISDVDKEAKEEISEIKNSDEKAEEYAWVLGCLLPIIAFFLFGLIIALLLLPIIIGFCFILKKCLSEVNKETKEARDSKSKEVEKIAREAEMRKLELDEKLNLLIENLKIKYQL